VVDHSDASSLIFASEFLEPVERIRGDLPKVKRILVSGECGAADMFPLEALCHEEPYGEPEVDLEEEEIACILYTAGTTGKPKGVLLSHRNCIWGAVNIAYEVDLEPDYRVLMVFPLYHAAAFMILMSNLFLGCTCVTMRGFDPRAVMERIQQDRIHRVTFPPTVWNFILQLPDLHRYDTTSVRALSSGAESMPLETKKRLLELFPRASLGETYGMTESAATITALTPKDVLRKMASVGKPFLNVEVRVSDDQDRDVARGEVGEILARGPNIMVGYYKEPEATREALRGGWLHTGDLGKLDEEGFLYVVDRKKDMIISGGENIYPREVEEVLYRHPKILEAAVIGLPDPLWGERVHAVVALRQGERMGEAEVVEHCRQHIASFKKPKSVAFVDRLPRSATGKVLKRMLREDFSKGEGA
jgi:acyl-CoA synthetase (AMP-forming)/AMP-acid ligase II